MRPSDTEAFWHEVSSRAGVREGGRYNAGATPLPHSRALLWHRADGSIETWSGQDLSARAGEIAAALRRAGVGRGDRVAGLLSRCPEALALPLAVWRLGAVYVPLFTGFGASAIEVRLRDSETGVIVTDPPNRAAVAEVQAGLGQLMVIVHGAPSETGDLSLDALVADAPEAPDVAPTHASDLATIMYTSGTSGAPKGCLIPHRGLYSLWPFVRYGLALGPDDVLFSTADTGWSFGLYTTGLAPLSFGASRVLIEGGFDAAAWWEAIRRTSATHMATAPTGLRQLAAAGTDVIGSPPTALSKFTTAGEPLGPDVVAWFQDALGTTVHDAYGLTELGMVVANVRGPGAPEPRPGSMGVALPGFDVCLLGDDGDPVAGPDAHGRLAVRDNGNLLGMGYWGRQAEWDARVQDGWWLTEDIARREGDRYWYVGRADDVIVTAGYNVGPFDVESALLEHPAIADAAVIGVPDPRKGTAISAHVVVAADRADADPPELADLRAWVGERIGWHAAPRHLQIHAVLPRTESGKIRRRDLRVPEDA